MDLLTRTVLENPFIPQTPTPQQALFLTDPRREAFYGGAAGGGKSSAILMAGLQHVDQPDYAGLILRRTYADLALPGAIMERSQDWLRGTAAKWNDTEKTWTFPSGATLTFGYLQHAGDKYRYQGSEFQFIGFDELTQFPEEDYRYLFSRLRRNELSKVPLRMRGAANPGGLGHEWVYRRFVAGGNSRLRAFIPAKLGDNPHLDREEYEQSLAELDPVTRRQLLNGEWVTDTSANPFHRKWWTGKNRFIPGAPEFRNNTVARYISWDTALKDKDDSAYSACVVGELTRDYRLAIVEVWQAKLQFPDLVPAIRRFVDNYSHDEKLQAVLIEDKASGASAFQTLQAQAPREVSSLLRTFQPSGSKVERANQASAWASEDCILLPYPGESVPWLAEFESQLFAFPGSTDKDQVDAFDQLVLFLEPLLASGYDARQRSLHDGSSV